MSTDEYVPSETEFRAALHDMVANGSDPAPEEWTAVRMRHFDALIARVKRDAARDALTAHANDERTRSTRIDDKNRALSRLRSADAAELFRDRHYPEETP